MVALQKESGEERVLSPPLGWIQRGTGTHGSTPWAIIFRPSGPGAEALGQTKVIPTLGALGGSA